LYFPVGVPWNEYKISFEKPRKIRPAGTSFTNILQTKWIFTKSFTNDTNKIQNTNGYKNIDIVIDIDIDILVNFVRFQRTEIYGGGASLLPTNSKIELKILIIFCII
jgi:hypothetical protein